MKQYVAQTIIPFFCGVVVAINLSKLLEINPDYGASWWKVALAVALAIAIPLMGRTK